MEKLWNQEDQFVAFLAWSIVAGVGDNGFVCFHLCFSFPDLLRGRELKGEIALGENRSPSSRGAVGKW